MSNLVKDIRYGTRMLIKNPGATTISVLALALGIGLTTMMFSIVYGALLRGLPFERPEQIVNVARTNPARDIERSWMPIHDYTDYREQQRSFSELAASFSGTVNVSGTERPERFDGAFITANAFTLLGARPLLGRTFRPEETVPGAPMTIILGYAAWQNRFGADPAIVGRTLRVNGEQAEVIGVMPEGFRFPVDEEVWVPLRLDPLQLERGVGQNVMVYGRLRDGVSIDQAMAEFTGIARRLAMEYPDANEGWGVVMDPYTEAFIGKEPAALLYTMLGAVFFVLLIACANVANLLLARAALRTKEVGIRSALGASKLRVVTQFLTEALVLSLAGAALGLGIAYLGVHFFNMAIAPTDPPFWIVIRIDPLAILFVMGVAFIATLAAGGLPALQAARTNLSDVLKDESRGSSSFRVGRLSKGLVVFEIALSCGLLVAAGLMIKSVTNLRTVDYGFPTAEIFTARLGLMEADYPTEAEHRQFYMELEERLKGIPDARSTALTTGLPAASGGRWLFELEGGIYETDRDRPLATRVAISPGFFETFEVAVRQGRGFGAQDREDALPVVIVNETFASKFFPGESPLGKRVRLAAPRGAEERPWMTVVGVVPDMYANGLENENPEAMYVPYMQHPARFMSIAVRPRGATMAVTPQVRAAVAGIDADLPLYFVNSLDGLIRENTWFYRIFGSLFMIFGFVALFLAAVGLYGVMATAVTNRTREVGVRMALGAKAADVLRLIFRQGLVQIGVGLVLGLALAAGLSHLLTNMLFQVEPRDPLIFGSIILVLASTGALACFVPALRATRVDPMVALRYD
jgi:putative ABC transport system permease protein